MACSSSGDWRWRITPKGLAVLRGLEKGKGKGKGPDKGKGKVAAAAAEAPAEAPAEGKGKGKSQEDLLAMLASGDGAQEDRALPTMFGEDLLAVLTSGDAAWEAKGKGRELEVDAEAEAAAAAEAEAPAEAPAEGKSQEDRAAAPPLVNRRAAHLVVRWCVILAISKDAVARDPALRQANHRLLHMARSGACTADVELVEQWQVYLINKLHDRVIELVDGMLVECLRGVSDAHPPGAANERRATHLGSALQLRRLEALRRDHRELNGRLGPSPSPTGMQPSRSRPGPDVPIPTHVVQQQVRPYLL